MADEQRQPAARGHAPSRWSLIREPLDWDLSPADALRLVRADAHPAALFGAWAGGSDVVCADPTAIRSDPAQIWDALDESWPAPMARLGWCDEPAFAGGWLGYLGFGLARDVLPVPPAPGGARRLPTAWLGCYDHVLRRDRASGRWFFEAIVTADRAAPLEARLEDLRHRARAARPAERPFRCGEFGLIPDATAHRSAVGHAVDYVWRGDIFQANICLRLEADFDGDPLDAFCTAVAALDPPYAAFLRPSAGTAVASLSPELFLRRDGRTVSSRPIKGTAARPPGDEDAAAARVRLERSAKDRAENVMIVDLMRNDLSRVCEPGSVVVPKLVVAEPHPGVWHLVSEVHGELRAGVSDAQLIRATFPPGSVTGAPKVRALEVIHELETTPREVYTGAIGYRSPVAGLELNVAIRTFEFHSGRVWLGAGGGIVAASRPGTEYRECLVKARPLVTALGGCLARRSRRASWRDAALLPRPAAGIFTSLLVRDGVAYQLGDHVDRLAASALRLYGKDLPASLDDELARCLAERPSGRLRITVRPLGGPLAATVEVVPVTDLAMVADLVPVLVPRGIGAHKWADRRLLARLADTAGAADSTQLLIEDTDGDVLETDRASVFAVVDGAVCTPPADGRLLPGVTRAAVLRLAATAGLATKTASVTRRDLTRAGEAFVTNSVRGVLPVRSIDGVLLPVAPGPVTARLAAALAVDTAGAADSAACLPPTAARGRSGAVTTGQAAIARPNRAAGLTRAAGTAPAVVVIDNYDSFTFNLVHYLATAGCAVEVVRNDEVTADDVVGLGPAGVVLSPGPCAPAEAGISIDVVRACAAAPEGIPVLGVCLGHQAIAACFGATIVRAPRPVHGQTSVITHDGRGVLSGLPRRFSATRYHSLIVAEPTLPPPLHVTARTSGGLPMGLRHARLPIEGVQFHPESILTGCGQRIISTFAATLRGRGLTIAPGTAS
jgi:para-aminobenzoate synthetase / 4-amino-4-deoxychorismate lyase